MILHTASETISFVKKLENEMANFYREVSQKYTEDRDVLVSFADENGKFISQIERAYYGVITDAIEGGYAFDMDTEKYKLDTVVKDGASYADLLNQAIGFEEQIINFYSDAEEQSGPLMADVPRAFKLIVKKRKSREEKLRSLPK
jgi:hypothetical protein